MKVKQLLEELTQKLIQTQTLKQEIDKGKTWYDVTSSRYLSEAQLEKKLFNQYKKVAQKWKREEYQDFEDFSYALKQTPDLINIVRQFDELTEALITSDEFLLSVAMSQTLKPKKETDTCALYEWNNCYLVMAKQNQTYALFEDLRSANQRLQVMTDYYQAIA